jgi:hypothetical protein
MIYNQMIQARKSPFLADIEDKLTEYGRTGKARPLVSKREIQLDLFE